MLVLSRLAFVAFLALANVDLDTTSEAAFAKSVQFERARNYEDAIKTLLAIDAPQQNNYLVQVRLGYLNNAMARYSAARTHYNTAVQISPNSTEARLGLILAVLAEKDYAYAEKLARQVRDVDPGNYFANLRLAYAMRMQGKFTEADAIDATMLEAYPSDLSFLLERGLVHVALKRDSAAKYFQRALLLDPTNVLARQQLGLDGPKTASQP